MQSKTGFSSSHQLKSYVTPKSRLKLAARCPVSGCWPSCKYILPTLYFSELELTFTFVMCCRPSVCLSVVCLWRSCTLLRRLKF